MKKHLLILTIFLALFTTKAFSQWTFDGMFPPAPDTLKTNTGVQFLAVDPDGKIWVAPYSTDTDSLFVPDSSKYKKVRPVIAFTPDGKEVLRITSVTLDGTLYPFYSTGYGLTADNNGNILYCNASTLYRLNYKTGEGMNRAAPDMGSLCSPAVDAAGNIYVAPVLPGNPVLIYDTDFGGPTNALDEIDQYGRWMGVSADGNTMYIPRFSDPKLRIYSRASEFDPFVEDSALAGIVCESGAWDPATGNLWLSVGSYFGPPSGQFAGSEGSWFSFNTDTWAIEDSINWHFWDPADPSERPRGIAFSADGTTAYCAVFGASATASGATMPNVEKFSKVTGVREDNNVIVKGYTLSQNYPNPFNPTTNIKFTIPETGLVTLVVYDMLGREVATLINKEMASGAYDVDFNAANLSSGTYIYTLSSNGSVFSKKMILLK